MLKESVDSYPCFSFFFHKFILQLKASGPFSRSISRDRFPSGPRKEKALKIPLKMKTAH